MGIRENIRSTITKTERGTGCVIPLIIVIFLSAGILRFVSVVSPTIQTPLITGASGMVELSELQEINQYVDTPITLPQTLFDASLEAIGVYPEINSVYPKDTVALVYVRDGWRFIEIDYKPNLTFEEQVARYTDYTQIPIVLGSQTEGRLIPLKSGNNCVHPNKEAIGVCRITKVLVFPLGDITVLIGADGQHATDGELIKIAQSMLPEPIDAEETE